MPKKRLNKTLQTKPSSSVPAALAASTIATSKHGESTSQPKQAPSSVNELINHLRQTQVSDEQSHRLQQTPRAATVHPSLRSILNVPDTPAPAPRPGNNVLRLPVPTRLHRIPGPPPPASWLAASWHAKKSKESTALTNIRIEQSSTLPGGSFPKEGSMQHVVLKTVATHVHWLLEYDSVHALPTRLKEAILGYVAVYHDEQDSSQHNSLNIFRLLFPMSDVDDALVDGSTDNSEVSRLDLGGAIGRWLSMKNFKELLYLPKAQAVREESEILPDSWDDERECGYESPGLTAGSAFDADATAEVAGGDRATASGGRVDFATASGRPRNLDIVSLRFSNLTHLSLALLPTLSPYRRRTAASWPDLLKAAASLSRLSSLSLAHWPSPTLTPHAASTHTTIQNPVSASFPGIPYGGSDMYTSFDGEWTEAANLLKILSRNMYCLQWLDLTGCGDWFAALSAINGAEWTGAWRSMQHVGMCVGWQPEPIRGRKEPIGHSEYGPSISASPVADGSEIRRLKYYHKKAVEKYMEIRGMSHNVAKSINSKRRGLGKWIEFDLSPELSTAVQD